MNSGSRAGISHLSCDLRIRGRGHDGLVNCVRTGMSKSVSISKTFVDADAIYSHKCAGHEALVSTFVAIRTNIPRLFLVLSVFPETDKTCKMNFSKSNPAN